MFSKNSYWRFAVSTLLLLCCLGFETATAHTSRKLKIQQQSSQTQIDRNVVNLLSPEAEEYLLTQNYQESDDRELKQTKEYRCRKVHHHRRRYRRARYHIQHCPCPVYHHHRPTYYYNRKHHHYRTYPHKRYRHGVPRHEIIYRDRHYYR